MSTPHDPDPEFETRISALLLDVLVRAGVVLALAMLCFLVFSPFLSLMAWALILAVALYPTHQSVAAKLGGRQGLAATLMVLLGVVVIVFPTAVLMSSLGDSVQQLIHDVQNNTLRVPPPREGVAEWPLIGKQLHAFWTKAYTDLPALVQSLQPKLGNLAKAALGFVAGIGSGSLLFLASLAVAGIMMAYGVGGARAMRSIFERFDGSRGGEFVDLSAATIRAVAKGVLGVAVIQAIIVGICLLVAGIPWAGVLAAIVLVLGIAQIPAVIVTLPAIVYLWSSGNYGTGAAVLYTGPPRRLRRGRQRAEAVDARPRRGCADASSFSARSAAWPRRASSACSSAPRSWRSATRYSWIGLRRTPMALDHSRWSELPGPIESNGDAEPLRDVASARRPGMVATCPPYPPYWRSPSPSRRRRPSVPAPISPACVCSKPRSSAGGSAFASCSWRSSPSSPSASRTRASPVVPRGCCSSTRIAAR
jgi:predicted PurR-regulated permease PerM